MVKMDIKRKKIWPKFTQRPLSADLKNDRSYTCSSVEISLLLTFIEIGEKFE